MFDKRHLVNCVWTCFMMVQAKSFAVSHSAREVARLIRSTAESILDLN